MMVSLLMRIAMKIIADFTGMLQARHPYEMGGAFWLFNMMYTQASVFVVLAFRENRDVGDDKLAFQQNDLQMIAGSLLGLWLVAIFMLVQFSEKEFRHTFYQRLTGYEFNKSLFDTGVDEIRMRVFLDHESYYSRYKGEIMEWLGNVWDKLHAEKPAWFTEEVIRRIPVEFIPHLGEEGVREEIGEEAVEEMRKSRMKSLSGSVRELLGFQLNLNDDEGEEEQPCALCV